MLGVHREVSSLAVYGDTGQFPIIVLQKISVLKYWYHIWMTSSTSGLTHMLTSLRKNRAAA